MSKVQIYAKELLVRTMCDYSDISPLCSRPSDLEYELWAFACGDAETMWAGSFGKGLQEDDRKRLSELANDAGGWYYWSDEAPVGEKFIPMEDWLKMYEEHKHDKS